MNWVVFLSCVLLIGAGCGAGAAANGGGPADSDTTAGAERTAEPPCDCRPASDPACQEMCAAQDSLGTSSVTNED